MSNRRVGLCLATAISCFALSASAQSPKHIDLAAPDGVKLKATYYSAGKPGPGVVLLHQCNRERSAWTSLATRLAGRGLHVLTLDYRGYGESGGERHAELPPQERVRRVNEVWPEDVDVAFRYLVAQPGVDKEKIGAAGASCGVNQSIQLARRHSNIKTVALLSGNTNEQGRDYLQYAPWMPVLAAASDGDGGILPYMRWLLGFSGNAKNKMLEYKAAGHGTDMFAVEAGLEPALVEWFEQHLVRQPVQRTLASAKAAPLGPSAAFWKLVEETGGAARAYEIFEEARKKDPSVVLFPEIEMNALGYGRLQGGQIEEAILLFKMNVAAYPESANVYDSLGDAFFDAGKFDLAREYARKAIEKLATDPQLNEQGRQNIRESAERKLRGTGGGAGGTAPPAARPPFEQVVRMPIVLRVAGMDAAKVHKDVAYKSAGDVELKMDVYAPPTASASSRVPVVLFISGAGYEGDPSPKDWGVYQTYGRLMAASGMAGVEFNKRYSRSSSSWASAEEDMKDLIAHLGSNADTYGIDVERICVAAYSAGGRLLAPFLREAVPGVKCVASIYGALAGNVDGAPEAEREVQRAFSPLHQIGRSGQKPPVFIARAGLDNPGLNQSIDAFYGQALAQGFEIEMHNHASGQHGFDILDDNDRSRDVIRALVRFLQNNLGVSP
jgi:dienelactone hydrolase